MQRLVDEADLPADLAVYLVWITGRMRDEWAWWPTVAAVGSSGSLSPADNPVNSGVGKWALMVDRLQVAAALVAGEASRQKFPEIRQAHDAAPWTVVLPGPPGEREQRAATDRARLGAPAFPVGELYVQASPPIRDRAGAATAGRREDGLYGPTP